MLQYEQNVGQTKAVDRKERIDHMITTIKQQIIVIGGGGFDKWGTYCPDNLPIERYILEQTGKARPKICFLPTASGDSLQYIVHFYQEFSKLNCQPTHLSILQPPTADLESYLLENDALYVGGGNTKNMLALWKEWGIDSCLRKAWKRGIVLSGISAGSICWFDEGLTDSIPGLLTQIKTLDFLKGSNCPHYDTEPNRRPVYHKLMLEDKITAGIAIDDNVAVHYVDGKIINIVKTTPQANAYRVFKDGGKIWEEKIELGKQFKTT